MNNNTKKTPQVSVIIPNYNHSNFLNQRIESVLNQTYVEFEVIILDDSSTDSSMDIINKYENDKHISQIVKNSENSGSTFIQWKKGFEIAKGDLIWIAESDDACEFTFLQELVGEFAKDEKVVLAFCKSVKIDINGNIIGEAGMKHSFHMNGKAFIDNYLYRYNYIQNASSVIFKKEILNEVDLKYTTFRGSGDWIFWVEISKCGNVAYVNKPLNYFRIHGANTTTVELHSGRNEAEAISVYQFLRKKKYIGYKKELRERIAHIYSIRYGKLHKVLDKEKKKELLKGWGGNIPLYVFTWFIHILQRFIGSRIIKR